MKKTIKVILIICATIFGLILAFSLLNMYTDYRSRKFSEKINVSVSKVNKEDSLTDVIYTISNTSTKSQKLDSIDIDLQAFDQGELMAINTKRIDEYSAFGMRTFEFRKDIQPGETIDVVFSFKRKNTQTKFIETDVCINRASKCIGRSFDL